MSYATFLNCVMLLQLVGAVWLVMRGRSIGYFFGIFAAAAIISLR